jgi:hypothetical protein
MELALYGDHRLWEESVIEAEELMHGVRLGQDPGGVR